MTSVLVVAAHPDDEALGCGGAMARHAAGGDSVTVVFVADGVSARAFPNDAMLDAALREREAAAAAAARVLGAQVPRFLRFPDNRCDSVALLDIVQRLEAVVAELAPTVVYTHHSNDLNVDHRIAHQATLTACRPLPGASVRRIYAFETASSTEWEPAGLGGSFRPVRYVDIGDFVEAKLAAIAAYDHEMRSFPHPRSPEALRAQMMLRGAQAGVRAAEAFMVVREIH